MPCGCPVEVVIFAAFILFGPAIVMMVAPQDSIHVEGVHLIYPRRTPVTLAVPADFSFPHSPQSAYMETILKYSWGKRMAS